MLMFGAIASVSVSEDFAAYAQFGGSQLRTGDKAAEFWGPISNNYNSEYSHLDWIARAAHEEDSTGEESYVVLNVEIKFALESDDPYYRSEHATCANGHILLARFDEQARLYLDSQHYSPKNNEFDGVYCSATTSVLSADPSAAHKLSLISTLGQGTMTAAIERSLLEVDESARLDTLLAESARALVRQLNARIRTTLEIRKSETEAIIQEYLTRSEQADHRP